MSIEVGELVGRLTLDDDDFDDGLEGGEKKFKGFGGRLEVMAAAAGVAAAAALGVALIGAMDRQDVGAKVAAQLGQTTKEAGHYGKLAGTIYADNFGESLEEVGDAIVQIQRAKIIPDDAGEDALKGVAEQALNVTSIFGQDMPRVVQAVRQMLATGMAPTAEAAFDIITTGLQNGDNSADDLLDTFNEYPTKFRDIGIDGKTALGLIHQGMLAGARDSDIVADALKEFSIRARDGSDASKAAFTSIGLDGEKMTKVFAQGGPKAAEGLQTVLTNLKAMTDPVERNATAVALFGTQAEDLGQALFALDPSTAVAGLGQVDGAINKAGQTAAATASGNIETFKRKATEAFVETLGGAVLPVVSRVADWLANNLGPALQTTGEWIKRNQEWLAPLAVTVGTFLGAVLLVTGAVKLWAIVTEAYTAVQTALNVAMDANPIGLIVLAIVALVAGLTYAYFHSEKFRKIVDATWSGIKLAVGTVVDWLVGTAWPWIKKVWDNISTGAQSMYANYLKPAFDNITGAVSWVMNIVTSLANLWLWVANIVFRVASGVIMGEIHMIGAVVGWLYDMAIKPTIDNISLALALLGQGWDWLYAHAIGPSIDRATTAFRFLWAVGSEIFGRIMGVIYAVGDVTRNVFSAVAGWVGGAFASASGSVRGMINGLIGMVNTAVGWINSNLIDTVNSVPGVSFPHARYIPYLATGGKVNPSAGGTPVVMGEAGQVEYGVPHSEMREIIGQAVAAGAGSGGGTLTIVIKGTGILRGIRETARVQGGDTQTVLVGG